MTPNDPLYPLQWHFRLIGDIETIWDEFDGTGVTAGVYDDGFEYTHPDLDGNYDASQHFVDSTGTVYDPLPRFTSDDHGTSVAGLLGAEGNNGIGVIGVAPGVTMTGVNYLEDLQYRDDTIAGEALRWAEHFDVMNNSWGVTPQFKSSENLTVPTSDAAWMETQFAYLSENGRGGLGTVIVQASGNESTDANGDGVNASRFTATIGATDNLGFAESYSNNGTAVLVVAPAATVTTDLVGQNGSNGIVGSLDYTNQFSGTSAATPVVSGVVALMLDANPGLGWRDVHTILALSAAQTGLPYGTGGWSANGAGNWNGGGVSFNPDYGFGMVDVFAAVRMAEAWSYFSPTAQTSANEVHATASYDDASLGAVAIPDRTNGANGVAAVGIDVADDIRIENIQLTVDLQHDHGSDLRIILVAPTGEEFAVLTNDGDGAFLDNRVSWTFGVTSALGMSSAGTWTVRVEDSVSGDTGTIYDATLDFYGSATSTDDVYHYTADFPQLLLAEPARGLLLDSNGGNDWLDLATIAQDVEIDLSALGFIEVDEIVWVALAAGSLIENAVSGDGDDSLIGNAAANELHGGRGDDQITDRGGADALFGEAGDDTFVAGDGADAYDGGAGKDAVDFKQAAAGVIASLATGGSGGIAAGDSYTAIENLLGSDFGDVLTGDGGANEIEGRDGADVLSGGGGKDEISDGDGADTVSGDGGDDTFIAGDGADAYDGGDDEDAVDFKQAAAGVIASLATGGSGGIATGDSYTAIENLRGSGFADTLSGDNAANLIDGREGNDILRGGGGKDEIHDGLGIDSVFGEAGDDLFIAGGGADSYDGGSGEDGVDFKDATAGVTASLATGGSGGIAAGDSYTAVENLAGSAFGDTLSGDGGVNRIEGRGGNDVIEGGAGGDQISLGLGSDVARGLLGDFFGDTITDFTLDDQLIFLNQHVGRDAITVAPGSAILSVDGDGNGAPDGSFTLEGDFSGGDFMAVHEGADTAVTFETFLPTLSERVRVDDGVVNGINNQAFLTGDGTSGFRITLNTALAATNWDNAIGVYEVDAAGNIVDVRILVNNADNHPSGVAEITGVEAGHELGFFIVQNGADWANGLAASDTLSFLDGASGPPATVTGGSDVVLAVNGTNAGVTVFHSYDPSLNTDGIQHALSGVDEGGMALSIGFEDITGGGDRDFQDVVFSVTQFDLA